MAAPVIKIKRSSVPGKIPTTASLPLGELALNTNDGKVYIQQDSVGIGSTVIVVNPWSVGLGSDTYNTFFTAGNVGIGTTIPTSKLHVIGDARVTGVVTATTFVGALTGTATSTTNIPNLTGAITSVNTTTSLGSFTSAQLATALTDETGSGAVVFSTSPTLVTPVLGAASATSIVVSSGSTFTNGPILVGTATSTGTASQRLQVDGGAYVSGSVGIGTTNPQDKLEINSLNNTDVKLRLANSASSLNNFSIIRSIRISDSQSKLEFQVNNAGIKTYFSIDHEGLVSVGQASASSKLVVKGNSGNQINFDPPGSILNIYSNTALAADTGGSITLGGVFDSSSTIRAFGVIKGYKENATDSNSQGYLSFLTNTGSSISEALRITSAGNLLIGAATSTGTASQRLQVDGGAYVSGNLGIGTTNPTSKLTVSGDVRVTGVVTATTFIGALTGTATSTTNIPNLTGAITSVNTTTSLGSFTSLQLLTALTDETGSGSAVFANSPTLVTPVLGSATATSIVVSSGSTFTNGPILVGTGTSTGTASQPLQVTGGAYVSGNLGIGTINPTVALQLSPNASISNLNGNTNFGITVGAAATVAQFYHLNGNASYLRIKATRNTAGADWTTASTKLLQVIDVTEQGYIEYNPSGSTYGMAFGSGATELVRLTSAGNLGIGTTNPTSKLHVIGDARITGVVTATTFVGALTGTATSTTNIPNLTGAITSNNTTTSLGSFSSSNLATALTDETGSGSAVFANSPTLVTPVLGSATATSIVVGSGVTINSSGINASGIITATTFIGTLTGTVTGTTSTELVRGNMGDNDQFRILVGATATNAGFVEIATADDGTEPIHVRQYTGVFSSLTRTATLLDSSGNTSFPNSVTATTFVGALTGTATSTTNIPNLTGDITSVNKATTLATVNSNVGTFGSGGAIPTITVNAKGLITGVTTTAVTSGTTITDDTSTNASRFLTFTSATSGSISAANVSSTKLIFNPSSGNLGVGTTNPTSKLHVVGDVRVTGVITATNFTSTSDISLKDNIQTIVNPLDKIIKLNGVTFNWKENQKPSIGVIAQELQEILPELVTQGDIKSVNYNGIIGVLIEAVKEQQKQIEELKDLVKNLTTPQ